MSIRHIASVTSIKPGTVIGFVLVRKHIKHRVGSEYAAWGHTIMGDVGRFPVTLVEDDRHSNIGKCRLVATIPGTVIDNDYQSRCAGVAYGSEKINDMVGQREEFDHSWSIQTFFDGQSSDLAFHIDPEYVEKLVVDVQEYLIGHIQDCNDALQNLVNTLETPSNIFGVVGEFGGKHDKYQAGFASHQASQLADALKLLECVQSAKCYTIRPLSVSEQIDGWVKYNVSQRNLMDSNDTFHEVDTTQNVPYKIGQLV